MAKTVKVSIVVDDDGTMRLTEKSAQKLGAGLDKVGKSAQTADRQLKGVAQASSNGSKNFAKQAQGISSGIVPAYAALAAQIFAIGAAFRFLRDAGDLVALQEGQVAYASATGVALGSLTERIIEATESQINFRDAAQAAAIGTASGLSPSQLQKLGTAAKDVSLILGRDVTDSFNRLVRGVTKAEPELLDELGIILRLKDATEEYARALGKNAEDLNSFERSQAVANDVLAQAESKYSRIVEITKPSVNTFNQFGKAFDDIINGIKKGANFILKPLAELAAFNPFATLLLAAPLLSKFFKTIVPQTDEFFSKMNTGLDNFSKKLDKANTSLNIDLTQLGELKNDLGAANALADQATSNILKLGDQTGISAYGFKKLAKDGRLSLSTIDLNIKNATKGLYEYSNMSNETRQAFIDNFKDMRVAVAVLEGKTKESLARTTSAWKLWWTKKQQTAVRSLQTVTAAVQKFANFFVKTITRIASVGGLLLIAVDLLPAAFKDAIKSLLGMERISEKLLKLRENFAKTNEEFKKFAETQRILGENANKTYEVSLARVTAFGNLIRTQELDDELTLLDNYNKRLAETNNYILNLQGNSRKLKNAIGDGFSYVFSSKEDEKEFRVLNNVVGDAQTVLAEYINQRYEAINSLQLSGKSVNTYRAAVGKLNNALMTGNIITAEQIEEYKKANKGLKNLITNVQGYIQAAESIGPKIQDAFKNLLPTSPLQDLSDEFSLTEKLFFKANKQRSSSVELTQEGLEVLQNMSSEDLKILKTNLRQLDILREQLRIEQQISLAKTGREIAFLNLSKGATSLQLTQLKAEKELNDLLAEKLTQENILINSIRSKIVDGEKLTEQEMLKLAIQKQNINLLEAQIALLETQQDRAYKLGMALKQGIENGLNTNIYDLITGDETSFKDAVLKTVKTSLEAAAKELSSQLTQDIIGGLFGKKETEEQKRNRELFETLESGGEAIRREIEEAFKSESASFENFKKNPIGSTYGSETLRSQEAQLQLNRQGVVSGDGLSTAITAKINTSLEGTEVALKHLVDKEKRDGIRVFVTNFPGGPDTSLVSDTPNKNWDTILGRGDFDKDNLEALYSEMGLNKGLGVKVPQPVGETVYKRFEEVATTETLTADKNENTALTNKESSFTLKKGADLFSSSIPMLIGAILSGDGGFGSTIKSIFGAASGGIMPGGVTGYANGGIVKRPTLGLVGEGKMNEAVVPLPDGKAIPVSMNGAGQNNNVTVNVSMDSQGNSQTDSQSDGQQGANLGKLIAGAVQEELQRQKRPGGILSPYGAA